MMRYFKNTKEEFGDAQPHAAYSVDDFVDGAEDICQSWAEDEYFHPETETDESKSEFVTRRVDELMEEYKAGIVECDVHGNEIDD